MEIESLETRTRRLEKIAQLLKVGVVVVAAAGIGLFVLAWRLPASGDSRVLHVRGIVVEDETGRPRILIGAPTPAEGRKRPGGLVGVVLLGEDGVDRMTIGTTPDAQVRGSVSQRTSQGVAVLLNDPKGNERGGFGFLDDGRVSVGLDRVDGNEGAVLTVNDHDDFAGLRIKDHASCISLTLGNSSQDGSRLVARDAKCMDRLVLGIQDSLPKLQVNDKNERFQFDALATRR